MLRLVSTDLKAYTISDLEALSELVAGLRLDLTLASNLREVLGLQTVGNGGRQGRQMAGNWLRLHTAASRSIVPALPRPASRAPFRVRLERQCPLPAFSPPFASARQQQPSASLAPPGPMRGNQPYGPRDVLVTMYLLKSQARV